MDEKFQTSFIPKSPIVTAGGRTHSSINLVFLIALVVFLMSVLGALGTFLYGKFLENQIAGMSDSLDRAIAKVQTNALEEWETLDARIKGVKEVLGKHIAISNFFSLLEKETIQGVQFTDFSYQNDGNLIKITMKGKAQSYSMVALQSDAFAKVRYIKDPVFSGLNLTDEGKVVFTFNGVLDARLLEYSLVKQVDTGSAPSNPTNGETQ